MNWTELLNQRLDEAYTVTEGLLDLSTDLPLDWKPPTGANWMTTGQVIMHCTSACGAMFKGLVTGDWGIPEGVSFEDMPPESMLPPAEDMPTVESVSQAKQLLAEDKALAFEILGQSSEHDLANKIITVPWDPREMSLGLQFLFSVDHLAQHKGQLFYYLKMQGVEVNTFHLWGM